MKSKPLSEYLPKKEPEKVLVQAKINADIHAQLKIALEKDDITMQDLIVASLKRYLDERKG